MARWMVPAVGAVFVAGLTAAAAPPVAAPDTAPDAAMERGRDLVLRNCGMCHATGVLDESPAVAAPPLRALARRYPVDSLGEALAEGIVTGHRDMPEFVFDPNDIAAIVRYLESIQTQAGAGISAPRPPGG